ncbi:MAG: hypothetical protein IKB42_00060 [Clostridia bacterium]|nr:hypothetical protein [Clostridia bacterium]
MTLLQAISIKLEECFNLIDNEKDEKKLKVLYKDLKKLQNEFDKVRDKDIVEMKKKDHLNYYCDTKPRGKKIIPDEEYASLMEKWGKIVGEQLLYPEEQEYKDEREKIIKIMKGRPKEDVERRLKALDYEWAHREERELRMKNIYDLRRAENAKISKLKGEKLKKYLLDQWKEPQEYRDNMYKSVTTVKSEDEE